MKEHDELTCFLHEVTVCTRPPCPLMHARTHTHAHACMHTCEHELRLLDYQEHLGLFFLFFIILDST